MKKVTVREKIKVYFVVTLAFKSSFTHSKLRFLGLRKPNILGSLSLMLMLKIVDNLVRPVQWISEYLHWVPPKYAAQRLQHSAFRSCENQRCEGKMGERKECNRFCYATILDVRLREARLLYKHMNVERVCKGNQRIEDYHIVSIARKAEWENQNRIDWDAVWREGDRGVANAKFAWVVACVTLLALDHKFGDSLEEQQRHQRVSQFVRELHKPLEIVAYSERTKHDGKDDVCDKSHKQTYIVACLSPIPTNSHPDVYGILSERGDKYPEENNRQQPK